MLVHTASGCLLSALPGTVWSSGEEGNPGSAVKLNTRVLARALTFRVIFFTEPTPKSLILGADENQLQGAFILGHFWPRHDFFNPITETRAG